VHFNVEGTIEFTAVLFVPGMAPFEQQNWAAKSRSIKLYVRRVFISDEFDEDLMPRWGRHAVWTKGWACGPGMLYRACGVGIRLPCRLGMLAMRFGMRFGHGMGAQMPKGWCLSTQKVHPANPSTIQSRKLGLSMSCAGACSFRRPFTLQQSAACKHIVSTGMGVVCKHSQASCLFRFETQTMYSCVFLRRPADT
jgi:hypothetical protein